MTTSRQLSTKGSPDPRTNPLPDRWIEIHGLQTRVFVLDGDQAILPALGQASGLLGDPLSVVTERLMKRGQLADTLPMTTISSSPTITAAARMRCSN
jgi:hypothetical protein